MHMTYLLYEGIEPVDLAAIGVMSMAKRVTLCIDTTLHLLERRYGSAKVDEVARIMEYGAARRANRSRFLEAA